MATSLHSRLVAAMPRNPAELSRAFDLDDMVQKKPRRQSSGVVVPGGARGLVVRTYRGILDGSEDEDPDSVNPEAHEVQVAWADGSVENIAREQIELLDRPFYAGDLVVGQDGKSLGLVVEVKQIADVRLVSSRATRRPSALAGRASRSSVLSVDSVSSFSSRLATRGPRGVSAAALPLADPLEPVRLEGLQINALGSLPLPHEPPLLRPLQAFEVGTPVIKGGHLGAVINCKVDYLVKLDSGHEFTLEHGMEGVRPDPRQGYPTEAYGLFPSQRIYVTGEWLRDFQEQLQTRQERRERAGEAEEDTVEAHRLCRGVVKSFAVRRVKVNWLLEDSETWSSAPPSQPLASQATEHDCSELLPLQQFVLRLGQPVYVNIRHNPTASLLAAVNPPLNGSSLNASAVHSSPPNASSLNASSSNGSSVNISAVNASLAPCVFQSVLPSSEAGVSPELKRSALDAAETVSEDPHSVSNPTLITNSSSSSSSSPASSSSSSLSCSSSASPEDPLYRLGVVESVSTRCCVLWEDGRVSQEAGRALTPVNVDRVPLAHSEFVVGLAILPHMFVTKKFTQDDLESAAREEEAAETRARAAGPAWWNAPYFGDTELGPHTSVPDELKAVEVVRALSKVSREIGIAEYLGRTPLEVSPFDSHSRDRAHRSDRGAERAGDRATDRGSERAGERGEREQRERGQERRGGFPAGRRRERRGRDGELRQGDRETGQPPRETDVAETRPAAEEHNPEQPGQERGENGDRANERGDASVEQGGGVSSDEDAWEDCGSEEGSAESEANGSARQEPLGIREARLPCGLGPGLVTGASVRDAVGHLQELFQCLQDAVGPANLGLPIYKRVPVLRSVPVSDEGEERRDPRAEGSGDAGAEPRGTPEPSARSEANAESAQKANPTWSRHSSDGSSDASSSCPRAVARRSRSPEAEAPARLHALVGRMESGEWRRELFQLVEFVRMASPSAAGDGSWALDAAQMQGVLNCVMALRGEAALAALNRARGREEREVGVVVRVDSKEKQATVAWLADPQAFFDRARRLREKMAETDEERSGKDLARVTERQLARFGIAMWCGGRQEPPRDDAAGALYTTTAEDYTADEVAELVRMETVPLAELSPLSRFLFFPGDCALLVDDAARLAGESKSGRDDESSSLEQRENAKKDKVYLQVLAACGGLVWCRTFDGRVAPFAPTELVPLNTRWCDMELSYEESSDEESEYSEADSDGSSEDDSEDRETQSYESSDLDEWGSDSGSTNVTDLSDPVGNGPSRCSSVERMSDRSQDVAGG
uniref:Uncharacterized protein n=1 Tax=Toxoplasma gondii COUG TaxID=1074873 RepID=A0A2G8Y8S6_TOXGO|nr:hypothetical protein TGCOUG_234560 [Toxoplasma gondii COUG]